MNFKALSVATSILTSQFLPGFPIFEFDDSGTFVSSASKSGITLTEDSEYLIIVNSNDYSFSIDNTDFNKSNTFNSIYTIDNIVNALGFIPNECEYSFSFYGNSHFSNVGVLINLKSSSDDSLDLELYNDSFDFIPLEELLVTIPDFYYYYTNYDNLYIEYRFYGDIFLDDNMSITLYPNFTLKFDYFEGYSNDDSNSVNANELIGFLNSQYYYNLGLKDGGISSDATMYDLIYDFISNNLLRSEQDTGGLARILTDTSIVLIFITLIMLLVFVFKWCSHNILGG